MSGDGDCMPCAEELSYLTRDQFRSRFRFLILLTWFLPPVVGISFLLYVEVFSIEQMVLILSGPLVTPFIIAAVFLNLWYFLRLARPICEFLAEQRPSRALLDDYLAAVRRFPLHYWSAFILYLIGASTLVVISADRYTDFVATGETWFRVHLVGLIVSVIVGLPIFFRVLDLFGLTLHGMDPERPVVTMRVKVLMLGAMMPLLVDTLLVQYYWSRTGYFSTETFVVWVGLEIVAIVGSLMFVRSMGQSLAPLTNVLAGGERIGQLAVDRLVPCSVDELGLLAASYQRMVRNIQAHNAVLKVGAKLNESEPGAGIGPSIDGLVAAAQRMLGGDKIVMLLFEPGRRVLAAVAFTGSPYRQEGYFRLDVDDASLPAVCFREEQTQVVNDVEHDARSCPEDCGNLPVRSVIAAPLKVGGQVIGVLASAELEQMRHYTAGDVLLIEQIASEAAVAISNHWLLEERMQAQRAAVNSEERVRLLLEATSDGIIGVDRELRCTFANRAAAELLGYQVDQLVGQDVHALVHDRDESGQPLARDKLPLFRAIAEQVSQRTGGAVLWRSDGDAVPVEYTANPLRERDQVTGAVMVFRNIAEAKAIAKKMDYLASHDPLTGLFNRREFESRLEQVVDSARRDRAEHVLCFLDLDQFKVVNDTCGHEAGDELLRQLAGLLHGRIRQHDTLARLGGDEFGVLLDSCPLGKAMTIADSLRGMVEEYRFAWGDKNFAVGVSIGMVQISADTESMSRAMSAADAACYMAKDSGRNRIHVYEPHDDEMNQRRTEMQWVSRLNEALDADRFVLRYQPIVPVESAETQHKAIEILLAMRDHDGNEIPPGAFIPAAERYNIMVAIDTWVVRNLFDWLREHGGRLGGLERCFVNLSGQSIGQEKFLGFLVSELSKGDLPAHKLCFEITETAAVANLSRAIHFIQSLKFYGCRFALDDFGSGMSSFAYLKTLPLDYLKIDGNFVRDMATDPVDRAMVQAIHQVGSVMRIETIAEFVEDEAILAELRSIGVDLAQGYGIAKPAPLAGFFD